MKPIYRISVCSAVALILVVFFLNCGPIKVNDPSTQAGANFTEGAQQIGDLMASVDEGGGATGNYGWLQGSSRALARLDVEPLSSRIFSVFKISNAEAATCATATTFSSCTGSQILRTFGGCTIGAAIFNGTVILNYSNPLCQVSALNDYSVRVPNFTVTGLRGATLAVTKVGTVGQKVTRTSVSPPIFTFTNDGINRKFTDSKGSVLFNFTTQTNTPITINGSARSQRVMSGGSLHVTNVVTGVSCDYVPSGVAWTANCNCAAGGSWTATCSDGTTANLNLTGCGTADFTLGSSKASVTFDRCYGT